MGILVIDDFVNKVLHGKVWRIDAEGTGILAGAAYKIGILVGAEDLHCVNRVYNGNANKLSVFLYQTTFTGGATPRSNNKRLSCLDPVPATVKEGVTATGVTKIFGTTAFFGSKAAVITSPGDPSLVILAANTSYVIYIVNGDTATSDLYMTFDLAICKSFNSISAIV